MDQIYSPSAHLALPLPPVERAVAGRREELQMHRSEALRHRSAARADRAATRRRAMAARLTWWTARATRAFTP